MSYPLLFLTAFIIALSGALMPGPMLAVTLGYSPRYGWKFGPLAVAGHGFLELALVSMVFLGAGPLIQARPVQGVIGLAGGSILIWMAKGMFAMKAADHAETDRQDRAGGEGRALVLGAVTSISNPYWTLWWATVGLAYLSMAAEKGGIGVALFFAGHICGDMAWYTLVSWAASRGRDLTANRYYRYLLVLCSAILLVLGVWFVIYGFKILL